MAGSWGPDHSRPTLCPQLSCLWQDYCVLCVLVLAADQGNPTVSPWWMSNALPRPLCIPSMAVNSSTLQYRRFERCAIHPGLQCETMTQIPTPGDWTNPWHDSSVLCLWVSFWSTTNEIILIKKNKKRVLHGKYENSCPIIFLDTVSELNKHYAEKPGDYSSDCCDFSAAEWMTAGGLSRTHLTLLKYGD